MSSKPRKVRRDALLKELPEPQQALVQEWLAQDGEESCRQRLCSELRISGPGGRPISTSTLYEALAYWRSRAQFNFFEALAKAQAQMEAEARGGMSAEQMEEAIDRNFIMLAASRNDTDLYKELRYLRIADQSAKTKARQKDRALSQKDLDLQLADRRVALLEKKVAEAQAALEDKTISAAEQAARIREIFKRE